MERGHTTFWWIAASAAAVGLAAMLGRRRQQRDLGGLQATVLGDGGDEKVRDSAAGPRVRFAELAGLPGPVRRYFEHVLTDCQLLIRSAHLHQTGRLRATLDTPRWMSFSAAQVVCPVAPGFVWNARVGLAPLVHLRIVDAYAGGHGASKLSLMSAVQAGAARAGAELDAGALHRYLAEAPWYPTALLPSDCLAWTAIDEHRAMATLTHGETSVSLEFRFNDAGEIVGMYTPARWGSFDGGYRQRAWEGRFADYAERDGMRIPLRGEVGWYDDAGRLQLVWQGRVEDVRYKLGC